MVNLIELIGNKKRMEIMKFFLTKPTTEFSQTEIISKLKLAKPTAIKQLNFLESNNLILTKKIGRTKLYKLNRASHIARELKRLFNLTSELLENVIENLKQARKIIVFGSFAKGEDTETSDVDIIAIGEFKEKEVQSSALKLSKKYNRKISIVTRTPEEYVRMPEAEKELWERVCEGVVVYEA